MKDQKSPSNKDPKAMNDPKAIRDQQEKEKREKDKLKAVPTPGKPMTSGPNKR